MSGGCPRNALTIHICKETDTRMTFSSSAWDSLCDLGEHVLDEIKHGLVAVYTNALRFLYKSTYNSYFHINDLHLLACLTGEKFVCSISGFAFRISIDRQTFDWHVEDILPSNYLESFNVISLSGAALDR